MVRSHNGSNSLPSMILLTLLVTISSLPTCTSESRCPAAAADVAQKGQSLLQVQPSKATVKPPSIETWQSQAAVEDTPARLPPVRTFPKCEMSNLTSSCLPGFMIIGMQKAGTSTLYNIMNKHPQIRPAWRKELLWFNGNFEHLRCDPPEKKPTAEEFTKYLHMFPALNGEESVIAGEFSATYMHCWCCPRSMRRLMPQLRVISQLRDPIERARSRWTEQHSWAKRTQTYGSFEEYIEKELPKLEKCLKKAGDDLELSVHCAAQENILGMSVYAGAVKLWLKHFQPEAFLVTYLDQLAKHPQSVASSIHRHLGIQDLRYNQSVLGSHFNAKGKYGWNIAQLQTHNSSALSRLFDFYRPHLVELKSMADAGLISPLPPSWIARWGLQIELAP